MNVQTIWENGVFRPIVPILIKHTRVTTQVPDEEVAGQVETLLQFIVSEGIPEDVLKMTADMTTQRDDILMRPFNECTDECLTEDHHQRVRAFALRDHLRREQGHTL
jgi:predicted DNA-binding antitoxin AbrB/MazE fold protein